jgi:hypothetical protein
MKKVYTATNSADAHIIKGLLEQRGIFAVVDGHYLQGGVGELPAGGFVSVSVNDLDYVVAARIVEKFDNGEVDLDEEELDNQPPYKSGQEREGNFNEYTPVSLGNEWKSLLLGFSAGVGLMFAVYVMTERQDSYDKDNDGMPDELTIFKGGRAASYSADRNYDGDFDLIIEYGLDGYTTSHRADDDFDGKLDTWGTYVDGVLIEDEFDTDGNGVIDAKAFYNQANISKYVYLDEKTGQVIKAEYFDPFRLSYSLYDLDGDGKFDKKVNYDKYGDVQESIELH